VVAVAVVRLHVELCVEADVRGVGAARVAAEVEGEVVGEDAAGDL
jgi:hypothetical protein